MESNLETMPFFTLTNLELIFELAPEGYLFEMFNQMDELPFSKFSVGAIEKANSEHDTAYFNNTHIQYPDFTDNWTTDNPQDDTEDDRLWQLEDEDVLWC
jgi:hypothetical protein